MIARSLVLFLAVSVTFSWNLSTTPKIKGQWVRCGLTHGGPYTRYKLSIGAKKTSAVLKVASGIPLFCVVTAVASNGAESGGSNEITITP
jgi:hypothetical protein